MAEYVRFELADEQKPKTKVWKVLSTSGGFLLGVVKWFSNWRQYCFFPSDETVFSSGCMKTITSFVDDVNRRHREDSAQT